MPRTAQARAIREIEPSGCDRQIGANALAQRGAAFLVERHRVGGRRALATQERRPVVVEVAEDGRDVDRANLDAASGRQRGTARASGSGWQIGKRWPSSSSLGAGIELAAASQK